MLDGIIDLSGSLIDIPDFRGYNIQYRNVEWIMAVSKLECDSPILGYLQEKFFRRLTSVLANYDGIHCIPATLTRTIQEISKRIPSDAALAT